MHHVRVGLVITSFPIAANPASGAFVAKLAEHMSPRVRLSVMTPASTSRTFAPARFPCSVRYFRYAPGPWQRLAHWPGGIPGTLHDDDQRLFALLLVFL